MDHEMEHEMEHARAQAIAVAKDRVARVKPARKARLLARVDQVLERWKREQAQPDGTIVVEPQWDGLLWLDALGREPPDERVPLDALQPEQCAGPSVRSKSDLFTRLWVNEYAPVREIVAEANAGHNLVMALLVERDGGSMPAGSLMSALHYIWKSVWRSMEAARSALASIASKKAEASDKLASARAKSAAQRTARKQERDAIIFEMAVGFYIRERLLDAKDVADKVCAKLEESGAYKPPTVGSIRELIKGAKAVALQRMRQQP